MLRLLSKFCHNDHQILCQPWSIEDHTYATDGHIMIRVARLPDVAENELAPDARQIVPKEQPAEWFDIPDCNPPGLEDCPKCIGQGKNCDCPECDGDGAVWLKNSYNQYECECKSCEGSGRLPECPSCEGTGKLYPEKRIEIGAAKFHPKYLLRLASLPNCKIGPMGPTEVAWFKFDGGEGVLMPVR
jgi:hypothetical protein